jgi:hypothetical protein
MDRLQGPGPDEGPYMAPVHVYYDEKALMDELGGITGFTVGSATYDLATKQFFPQSDPMKDYFVEPQPDTPEGWRHDLLLVPYWPPPTHSTPEEVAQNYPGECPALVMTTATGPKTGWMTSEGEVLKPGGSTT